MNREMNINLNNYEAYFLDYHEGNLSPDLVKELMGFLSQYPELRKEFESFEPITLQGAEEVKFDKKNLLKKQAAIINASNFDEYAIEYVEGNLPDLLQQELFAFIAQNPWYQKELELYTKTKLTPDTSIVFNSKDSLKRRGRSAAFYYWSAAASVAIVIGAYFLLNKSAIPDGNNIVKHNQVKDTNVIANHAVKSVDTTTVSLKNLNNVPANNLVRKNDVVKNIALQKQDNKEIVVPVNSTKDSSAIAVNKGTRDNDIVPVKKEIPAPLHSGNDSIGSNDNSSDEGWVVIQRPIKKEKRKKEKTLAQLATITCQGLHTITGQHIELEKKYASDTTTIMAYQLDLGNKKFEFPVKE